MLGSGPLLLSVVRALCVALPHLAFDSATTVRALEGDYTQATDVAEGLVRAGVPFRTAYQLVGTLVSQAQALGEPLATVPPEVALAIDARLEAALQQTRDVRVSVRSRESAGGTGPVSVAHQVAVLRAAAAQGRALAASTPRLEQLFLGLKEMRF